MPTYKMTCFCTDINLIGDEEFSFNGHVTASTTLNAWERANEVGEALVGTVFPPNITIHRIGVSNTDVVNGSLYKDVSLVGTRTITGDPLPGWNVARVQFTVAEGVRPSTFFLRMGLTEDDVAGQTLVSAALVAIDDFIAAYLLTGANVTKDGFPFTVGSKSNLVHMRQLAWRRRHRPGFKRGWVPV